MSSSTPVPLLHVLAASGRLGRWGEVAAHVAALVGMEPVIELRPVGQAADEARATLTAAAAMDGAVLVLPDDRPATVDDASPARLRHVLVPFDRSRGEALVLRPLIRRALEEHMAVEQVHVLSDRSRPAIWEGAGHHARAWHDELRRRHQVGTAHLTVRSGEPPTVIGALAAGTDLVVACWNGQVGAKRARVLREILAGVHPPLLLLRAPGTKRGEGCG